MNTYSVLILDDEEFSVDVLMEDIHWEKCGISQVHGVYSVRQAKEFLKKNAVNILICDIEMPGENGLDLVEWAMEYARFSKDPMICIMLTCHGAFYRVGACTECFPESSIHDASFQKRDQHVCAGICDGAADSAGKGASAVHRFFHREYCGAAWLL